MSGLLIAFLESSTNCCFTENLTYGLICGMEINTIPPIKKAAELLSVPVLAGICTVSPVAVYKWIKKGRLPRTEWTGETNYAGAIAQALAGRADPDDRMTRDDLLQLPAATAPIPNQPEQVIV
jgi:predicted DNA-binding transcriptional regulator AlpA